MGSAKLERPKQELEEAMDMIAKKALGNHIAYQDSDLRKALSIDQQIHHPFLFLTTSRKSELHLSRLIRSLE